MSHFHCTSCPNWGEGGGGGGGGVVIWTKSKRRATFFRETFPNLVEKTASTHPNGWPSHKSHYGFWTKDVCLAEDQFHRNSIHFHKRLICGLREKGILKTKTKNANSCGKPSLAWIWAEKVKLRPLYRGITRSWGLAGSWDHGIRWGGHMDWPFHSIDWFTRNQFLKKIHLHDVSNNDSDGRQTTDMCRPWYCQCRGTHQSKSFLFFRALLWITPSRATLSSFLDVKIQGLKDSFQ